MARLLSCPQCRAEFAFDEWARTSSCPACGVRLSFLEASARAMPGPVHTAPATASWNDDPPVLRTFDEPSTATPPTPSVGPDADSALSSVPTAAATSPAAPVGETAAPGTTPAPAAPSLPVPAGGVAAPAAAPVGAPPASPLPAGAWTWSDTGDTAPAAAVADSAVPAAVAPGAPPAAASVEAAQQGAGPPAAAAAPDATAVVAPAQATPQSAPSNALAPGSALLDAPPPDETGAVLPGAALPLVSAASPLPAGTRRHVYTIGGKALEWSTGWTIALVIWAIVAVGLVAVRVDMGRLTVMTPAERAAVAAVQRVRLPGGASTETILRWSTTHKLTLEGHLATIPAGGTQMWYAFDRPWQHRIYVYSELPGASMVGNDAVMSWSVSSGVVKADGSTAAALAKAAQIKAHPPSPHSVPAVPGIIPSIPPDMQ